MKLVLAGAQGKRCRRCAREAKHHRRTSEPSGESKREKKQRKAEFGVGRRAIYPPGYHTRLLARLSSALLHPDMAV